MSSKDFSKEEMTVLLNNVSRAVNVTEGKDKSIWTNILLKLQLIEQELEEKRKEGEPVKFNHFEKDNLKKLRKVLNNNLEGLKRDYGLGIKLGHCDFNTVTAKFKLEITAIGNGNTNDPMEVYKIKYLEDLKRGYGNGKFKPEHFGVEFNSGRDSYKFIGFLPNGKKYIYKALRVKDNGNFKFTNDIEKYIL